MAGAGPSEQEATKPASLASTDFSSQDGPSEGPSVGLDEVDPITSPELAPHELDGTVPNDGSAFRARQTTNGGSHRVDGSPRPPPVHSCGDR